jgi:hypothetical protein
VPPENLPAQNLSPNPLSPNPQPPNQLSANQLSSPAATPIEHQNVPQAHQGLHEFLYSSDDEHSTEAAAVAPALGAATEAPVSLATWCDDPSHAKIAGVYAVLDSDRQAQFIGYSRNIALSLRGHLSAKGEGLCALVRVQPFKFPKRDAMEALKADWLAALPSLPPGNADGTWAASIKEAASQVMSPAEREAYEAKKLKLRRAMADGTLQQVAAQAQAQAQTGEARQADLAAAMEDDNWSAIIREQTDETQT